MPILGSPPALSEGKRFWRSLEEAVDPSVVEQWLGREFLQGTTVWQDSVSRRKFLTLMGASFALAGIAGCSVEPAAEEDIVPYVRPPELIVPGRPLFFATTMTVGGDATGLLVESHMGRPVKVEGNPSHPASLGATAPQHQASVLTLYDPDRAQAVKNLGQESTWEAAGDVMRRAMAEQRSQRGTGLRILTPTVVSPTLERQLEELLSEYPNARWCTYDPLGRENVHAAAVTAFGQRVTPIYDFTHADVVLSLDSDFLFTLQGHIRYAHDFFQRRGAATAGGMNRLYVAEAAVSCTGAKADHRLAMRNEELLTFARRIEADIEAGIRSADTGWHGRWSSAVAEDLSAHRGRSLVVVGDRQPAAVHLLAHALNARLENVGKTVRYIQSVESSASYAEYLLPDLATDMHAGNVELLLILGGNPVYTAPPELRLTEGLEHVPLRMHLSLYEDETSQLCHWRLPAAHFLESWSDARAFDGTASIVQPLIRPMYQGRSTHEVLALLARGRPALGQQIVKQTWRSQWANSTSGQDFYERWQLALHDGVIENSAYEAKDVILASTWREELDQFAKNEEGSDAPRLELNLLPDPTLIDGEFANNGWLQELPKPVTLLTWGNAAIVSPKTADRLGVRQGAYVHGGEHGGYHMPLVELSVGEQRVRGPVWIMPGHADDTVTVYLGNGRRRAGRVGDNVGFDAYPLRAVQRPWFGAVKLLPVEGQEIVACTQVQHSMEGRDIVRSATLADFQKDPKVVASPKGEESLKFYDGAVLPRAEHQWGMTIDLTKCLGCNACIVACQAENNIPVVGKEQVAFGRVMQWLRVDRYLEGPADAPSAFHFQPLPCMHCENAPCEYVCPVEATVHSSDGLNDMVYNRCVGTRFCSNNCPYKVRRFNFLAYANAEPSTRRLQYNPDVTVRSRGVMEKCTYCVQRIRQAEIDAQSEDRPIRDGEILTACQAACPAQAIVFGDIADANSEVRRLKKSQLNYELLGELNTSPRTTYLSELRNPNPALVKGNT